MIYPNLVAKHFIISIKVKADSFRLFGIAALIPLVFSFQKASHMPLHATNAQFTYAANTCDGNNDILLMESTFLLRFTVTNIHFLYLYLLNSQEIR